MEFLDEFESKPRFVLQSKHLPHQQDPDSSSPFSSLSKPALIISLSFSLFTFILAFFYFNFDPFSSLLLWLSLSFLIGPFAPPSLTAGDIRVGLGPPLKEIPKISDDINEKPNRKSSKTLKKAPEGAAVKLDGLSEKSSSVDGFRGENKRDGSKSSLNETKSEEQSEWGEADEELLKKLMGKHPPGKPGRWEAIAEGFNGKHKVESVIAKAKETGDKKVSDQDSYRKFLKDRKPVDKRALDEEGDETIADENVEEEKKASGWTSVEDLALLSALKAFPKDVTMRWEKVAASVPGKTKSACMKRVVELKKDFRSSKASPGQAS